METVAIDFQRDRGHRLSEDLTAAPAQGAIENFAQDERRCGGLRFAQQRADLLRDRRRLRIARRGGSGGGRLLADGDIDNDFGNDGLRDGASNRDGDGSFLSAFRRRSKTRRLARLRRTFAQWRARDGGTRRRWFRSFFGLTATARVL